MSLRRKGTYRRRLPSGLIEYCCDEGKLIFKEALDEGHLGVYFKIAANFQTQSELAYCGLTSLVMAHNALKDSDIAGGWWHEEMLSCYINLEEIRGRGITFRQLLYLAECIGLSVEQYSTHNMSDDDFRDILGPTTAAEDKVVIVNYLRSPLGQTGGGHVSPLGGYCPSSDMVLVMDVARFKYSPHWVPLSAMRRAIDTVDTATNERRGFCVASLAKDVKPHIFFKLNLLVTAKQVDALMKHWASWLASESSESSPSQLLDEAVAVLGTCARRLDRDSFVLTHESLHGCSAEHMYSSGRLFETIRLSDVYLALYVMPALSSVAQSNAYHLRLWRGEERRHGMSREVTAAMVTTMILYSWPYFIHAQGSSNGARLAMLVENSSSKQSVALQREIVYLKQQFLFIVSRNA